MAATDKHYRNQKTLNLLFAFSCVAMLLSILWMLVDDYKREYKQVQRDFRDVEESVSLNAMLDRLPNEDTLSDARETVAEKRQRLDEKKKELDSEIRRINVERAKIYSRYQDAKGGRSISPSLFLVSFGVLARLHRVRERAPRTCR